MAKKKRQPSLTAARAAKLVTELTRASEKLSKAAMLRNISDRAAMLIARGLIVLDADVKAIKKMMAE